MNTYRTKFFAQCPVNGVRIEYALTIHTGELIQVEAILAAVAQKQSGFHEAIADNLQLALGGTQVLLADHHGVQIETTRPHVAHWQRAEAA